MGFELGTNLAELPFRTWKDICLCLNSDCSWKKLAVLLPTHSTLRPEVLNSYNRLSNPSDKLLRHMANRGYTVKNFIVLLDRLGLVGPQLILKRKFLAVKIVKQPAANILEKSGRLELTCEVRAFPYPTFQWYCNDNPVSGATSSRLLLSRCINCTPPGVYTCRIRNEVCSGEAWSAHYRKAGKEFFSEATTVPVVVDSFLSSSEKYCDCCKEEKNLAKVRSLLSDGAFNNESPSADLPTAAVSMTGERNESEVLVATDKVALIICNSEYQHLPELLTPPCDAEVLAEGLLKQGFKTVTLADLTLSEMKSIILEYKRLLANGIYAVFYFAGHGFEAHGRCYLLPVDAPGNEYKPSDCLCVEWMLAEVQETDPTLNLVLLDMCRRCPPLDIQSFVPSEPQPCSVKRNTVFGYATSFGVGAYEVRGEINGIFMKYLKNYLGCKRPVTDILNKVLTDLEMDSKAGEVQFPELRTNLSRPRSLTDPIVYDGHTVSFDHRTLEWQLLHELPDPARIIFEEQSLRVTVWFDFCGHFTNMAYVYSSVTDMGSEDQEQTSAARQYVAKLQFSEPLYCVRGSLCTDVEEGVSFRTLLKNLQKVQGQIPCIVQLCCCETGETVAEEATALDDVLIARLKRSH